MILVTGARGFIGSALTARLRKENHDVVSLNSENGGVLLPANLAPLAERPIDHVFHLAGRTFIPDSWDKPDAFAQLHLTGTQNVLDFCRATGASMTFVSAYVYGVPEKLPISENDPVNPNNYYACTKYLAERMCAFYAKEFGVAIRVIRPFNVFGVGQASRFLIPTILEQVLHQETITLQNLAPKRDFVYLEDMIDALMILLENKSPFAIYNIGSGYSLSVMQIVRTVQELHGTRQPIHATQERRTNEIDDVIADIHKANTELNWFPRHSFREGVARIIARHNNVTP